ncbi:MAG: MurR/RpiR family transcriptional regulator [Pseudomonadota bacterium]
MHPTLRASILKTLKEELPGLPPRLGVVAKYITDHPADFGLDPIRETSRKCGVSTFSLVRLAHRLGFESYEALRQPFRQSLLTTSALRERGDWLQDLAAAGDTGAVLAETAATTLGAVERSLQALEPAVMDRIVDRLLAARRVYLTGTRASWSVAYYLHYVGRMPLETLELIPRHVNSPADDLTAAGPDDALIAITIEPYGRDTIEACRLAQAKGMTLIVIADSDILVPDLRPDEALVAATLSPSYFATYAGVMAIVDCLVAVLSRRGGVGAAARIESFERMRRETAAYFVASKNNSFSVTPGMRREP